MKTTRKSFGVGILLLCGVAFAGDASISEDRSSTSSTVRVYTNADLAKFGPPSPISVDWKADDSGWEFVTSFIEREQARLRERRQEDLTRQAIEQTTPVETAEPTARLAWNPWLYRPVWPIPRARIGGFQPKRDRQSTPPDETTDPLPDPARHDRIVPLHARTPLR